MDDLQTAAGENLEQIRRTRPLVHNITNYVVMNYTANALLAMGAAPVMAHAENEVSDMVALAGSLVINIGTLSDPWIKAMFTAGKTANQNNIPIILDPVGSGATKLRTDTARKLAKELKIAVIRGNASEVLSLADVNSRTKGVDSLHSVDDAAQAASILAEELDTIVAITGEIDLITDSKTTYHVRNGHPLMGHVTGTGCTATTAIAAFCAVNDNYLQAAAFGLGYFGLAGEKAGEKNAHPGSFAIGLLDALHEITPDDLRAGIKLEVRL
jgi:hydroxyethylthiazole kinase